MYNKNDVFESKQIITTPLLYRHWTYTSEASDVKVGYKAMYVGKYMFLSLIGASHSYQIVKSRC